MITAQAFTTGARATSLSRVELRLGRTVRTSQPPPYTVSIHAADKSGNPGTSLGTLTNPSSLPVGQFADAQFNPPAGGITLAGSTTYFVVLDVTGGTQQVQQRTIVETLTEDAELAGATAGWSLADETVLRLANLTAWGPPSHPRHLPRHDRARRGGDADARERRRERRHDGAELQREAGPGLDPGGAPQLHHRPPAATRTPKTVTSG